MLRSLGQSLLAKSNPGAAERKLEEQNIEQPDLPGKAAPGTVDRSAIEEPLTRNVPAGSEKVVAAKPTVEGTTVDNTTQPLSPVLASAPGVGLPDSVSATTPKGAQNQPLFQGLPSTQEPAAPQVSAASTPVQQGGAASVRSNPGSNTGGVLRSILSASTQAQPAVAHAIDTVTKTDPFIHAAISQLGGRAFADQNAGAKRVNTVAPTTVQQLEGTAGRILNTIGSALHLPQLAPGGLGAQLQAKGGQRSQGDISGSVSKFAGNAFNNLRSLAGNAFSGLRSLFGGRR